MALRAVAGAARGVWRLARKADLERGGWYRGRQYLKDSTRAVENPASATPSRRRMAP